MQQQQKILKSSLVAGLIALSLGASVANANPCNPCAPKANPCAAKNPCTAKNPCRAKNPCAANPCAAGARIDPKLVTRPKGTKPYTGNSQELVKAGEKLWNSPKLSGPGTISCASCHTDGTLFQTSFAKPYPHKVQMVSENSGLKSITLEEMVQFCMVKPMQAKPLPWDSRDLAALTAYTAEVQKSYKPGKATANPCAANPCAAKKPY